MSNRKPPPADLPSTATLHREVQAQLDNDAPDTAAWMDGGAPGYQPSMSALSRVLDAAHDATAPKGTPELSPEIKETLAKIRRGATTTLSPKRITAALTTLGIRGTPRVVAVPVVDTYSRTVGSLAACQAFADKIRMVPALPETLGVGELYATAPIEWQHFDHALNGEKMHEIAIPKGHLFVGVPGMDITIPGYDATITQTSYAHDYMRAPHGGTPSRKPEPATIGLVLGAPDPVARLRVVELASEALGILIPEKEKERKRREAMGIKARQKGYGTCPVCFEAHSIHDAQKGMVQHGYKMHGGGHSYGHQGMYKAGGDCWGVAFPRFEVSPMGTKAAADRMRNKAQGIRETLGKWERDEINDLALARTPGQYGRSDTYRRIGWELLQAPTVRVSIGPTDPKWAHFRAEEMAELREDRETAIRSADWFDKVAAEWPKDPYTGEDVRLRIQTT